MGSVGAAIEAGLALRGEIEAAIDQPIENSVGDFVAADPATIPDFLQPAQSAYRTACDIWAATGGLGELAGGAGLFYNPACGQYLGDDLPAFAEGDDSFVPGGQCPGTNYSFNAQFVVDDVNNGPNFARSGVGPITIVNGTRSDGGPSVTVVDGNGADIISGGSPPGTDARFDITNMQRSDGMPDDCGDFNGNPDGYPPTRPGPGPAPGYDFNPGGGPAVPIIIGNPTFTDDGFSLPVQIGDQNIDLGAGWPGGIVDDGSPQGPDYDNPSPDVPVEGTDDGVPSDPGNTPDGLDEDVEGLACVLTDVRSFPTNADRERGTPEGFFGSDRAGCRGAGWVIFKTAIPPFNIGPYFITLDNQMHCPPPGIEATGYKVHVNLGYTVSVRHLLLEVAGP